MSRNSQEVEVRLASKALSKVPNKCAVQRTIRESCTFVAGPDDGQLRSQIREVGRVSLPQFSYISTISRMQM